MQTREELSESRALLASQGSNEGSNKSHGSGASSVSHKNLLAGIRVKLPKEAEGIQESILGPPCASGFAIRTESIWRMYDGDGDGWLSSEEIERALRDVGVTLTPEEVEDLTREVEDEVELWSEDDHHSSGGSVDTDDGEEETVYEDEDGLFRVLHNHPKGTVRRLVLDGEGHAVWKSIPEDQERLDASRPENIINWVSATSRPGRSLEETVKAIRSRTDFFQTVHRCQVQHETNGFRSERLAFHHAMSSRSLKKSRLEETVKAFLRNISSISSWANIRLGFRRLETGENVSVERKDSLIALKCRPSLQRVRATFFELLIESDEKERWHKFTKVYDDYVKVNGECDIQGAMRALRKLGIFVNKAEISEMYDAANQGDSENAAQDWVEIDVFNRMCENLFQSVIKESSKNQVIVKIIEANDLPEMDRFGSADPFAQAEIVGKEIQPKLTRTIKSTLNPMWNEEIVLSDVQDDDKLLVSICDDETSGFGPNVIGVVEICLQTVIDEGLKTNQTTTVIDRWFPICNAESKEELIGKYSSTSRIRCVVSYVRGSPFNIKHQFSKDVVEFNLINLKLVSAENLPHLQKDDSEDINTYCTFSVQDLKLKSKTCARSRNPSWNEQFQMVGDLHSEILISLFDHDDEAKDECIGHCRLRVSDIAHHNQEKKLLLRSTVDNSFVLDENNKRASITIETSVSASEDLKATCSKLEIIFAGLACDHQPTVLNCCSALWQILQDDDDNFEKEALAILDGWQTMADVLRAGELEFKVFGASDLPRMDYFGLCDPYVVISFDELSVKTEILKQTLDPTWDCVLRLPFFQPPHPREFSSRSAEIKVDMYDWDQVGEHDFIGGLTILFEDWMDGCLGRQKMGIYTDDDLVRRARAGERVEKVKKPVVGHSGRNSMIEMEVKLRNRHVFDAECREEMSWAIAFAVRDHAKNAEAFGKTFGGMEGLVKQLLRPQDDDGGSTQAAAYALGNLAASYRENQDKISACGGVEALTNLVDPKLPLAVQQAACLSLCSVLADNPANIKRLLRYKGKEDEEDELVRRCGGIGKLLVLIRDIKPNAAKIQAGEEDLWEEIAFTYEAAIQAVSASAFINPGGLFSIGRSTVRQVAIAMGRAGLRIIEDVCDLPVDLAETKP